MATGVAPEPEDGTVVLPDWAMLDRIFYSQLHDGIDAAREAVNKNKTAALVKIDSGHSCFVLNRSTLFAFVRATDKDLVLFQVSIPDRIRYLDAPPDLFVYTAAVPPPSVQQLPHRRTKRFLAHKFTIGILQLEAEDRYIVADLNVHPEKEGARAELCVLNSDTREWRIIPEVPAGHLPDLWWTDEVLAFDGRFLCWVDYFSGVVLCDFAKNIDSQVFHFVPFPLRIKYRHEARFPRYFPGRFRSVSISQGMMRYVHIDNDFHETIYSDCHQPKRPKRSPEQRQRPKKITIWTFNMTDGNFKFEWEVHRVINLDCLWAQFGYQALGLPRRLPEFPIVSVGDPDVMCCLLRKKEFEGKAWMIMVDMNHVYLRSCTPYINRQSYYAKCVDAGCAVCVKDKNMFPNMTLLPTVFSKYLKGQQEVATRSSLNIQMM
ncbi:hypothetical protein VPH35_093295 [Triticum aestivum]